MKLYDKTHRKGHPFLMKVIAKTYGKMVDEFGLMPPLEIDNNMSAMGQLDIISHKDGIVNKFGRLRIRTTKQNYGDLIDTIVHEFCHINYPFCHMNDKKLNIKGVAEKHEALNKKLVNKVAMELIEEGLFTYE